MAEVGRAIADSGIAREDITVVTKCGHDAEKQASVKTLLSVGESLGKLSMQYVDLLLIHWPHTRTQHDETWLAMQQLQRIGKARAIGVCNYTENHLAGFRWHGVHPFVNQIEYHPYVYSQGNSRITSFSHTIPHKRMGYSTFAGGQGDDDPTVQQIAQAHNTTPGKVLIRWSMQHDVIPLVRSRNPEHIRSNLEVKFTLTPQEMAQLNTLKGQRLFPLHPYFP